MKPDKALGIIQEALDDACTLLGEAAHADVSACRFIEVANLLSSGALRLVEKPSAPQVKEAP